MSQNQVSISNKNLAALFVASLVPFTVGNMLTNLLPLYADELGVSDGVTGFFMASIFLAVASGTAISGWLSDVYGLRKTLLVVSGIANTFCLGLMGLAETFEVVVVLTLVIMFFIGAGQNTISVLVGLLAAEHERGRTFGIVGLTFGLGLLIGGFGSGPIVEHGGFPVLFFVAAIVFIIQPSAIATLHEETSASQRFEPEENALIGARLGLPFYMLSAASLLAFMAQFIGVLGRPLVMDNLGFSIITISIAFGASGTVVAPLTFFAGRASDRVARKPLIMLAYMSTAAGLVLMVGAESSWEFVLSAMLLPAVNVSLVIGLALMTDLVPPALYGRAISIYNSTVWVGAVIGFTTAGSAIEYLGSGVTFTGAFVLALTAILLLLAVREPSPSMGINVFVSSSHEDLTDHRWSVNNALRGMGIKTNNVFEEQTEDAGPLQTDLLVLRTSDLFLGIYASHYGTLRDGQEVSRIEHLYEESSAMGLPRLIYVVDPREDWPVRHLHTGFYGAKMRIFLDRLYQENPKLQHFSTPSDLVEKITDDMAQFRTHQRKAAHTKTRHVAIGLLLVSGIIVIAAVRAATLL